MKQRILSGIPDFYKVIQSFRVLAVALEAALTGPNITEIEVFQNQHLDTSSAVNEVVKYDLFCPVLKLHHEMKKAYLTMRLKMSFRLNMLVQNIYSHEERQNTDLCYGPFNMSMQERLCERLF